MRLSGVWRKAWPFRSPVRHKASAAKARSALPEIDKILSDPLDRKIMGVLATWAASLDGGRRRPDEETVKAIAMWTVRVKTDLDLKKICTVPMETTNSGGELHDVQVSPGGVPPMWAAECRCAGTWENCPSRKAQLALLRRHVVGYGWGKLRRGLCGDANCRKMERKSDFQSRA